MANIFCKVDKIPGESKEKSEYFDVLSFNFVVSQHAAGAVGGTGGHIAGKPSFEDIVVVKQADKASAGLALACAKGTHINEVIIEAYRNLGDDKPSKYLEYKLTKAVLRSVSLSGAADQAATETLAFGFSKLNWLYIEYDDDSGKKVSENKGEWDLQTNTGK